MVIRITWGKLRAGTWDEFEGTYRTNVVTKGKNIKGLRGRWLSQDAGDKDTGFAVSLWDSLTEMQAYEQSTLYKEIMPRIRRVGVLVNPDTVQKGAPTFKAMERTAGSLKVGLERFELRGPSEFESAFSRMAKSRVDAVVVSEDSFVI